MAATTAALLTVEEFQELPQPEGQRLELIQGEVVSMPVAGYPHEIPKSNFGRILNIWLVDNPIGKVFTETGFVLDEHNAPIPDVSLVLNHRLVPGTKGPLTGAPDLAIEVVSSETASHLETKLDLYLAHGSKAVIVAYPEQRVLRVYDASGVSRKIEPHEVLEGMDLLPGFRVPVSAIFEGV